MEALRAFKFKHVQLREILQAKIEEGELKPGMRFPSENELIRQYGVSNTTVKKAIGELVHKDLLYRIQGKGTFVCEPKKQFQLKSLGKTGYIGLAVYNIDYITNPFFSKVISGVGNIIDKYDCNLQILSTNGKYAQFKKSPFYLSALEEGSIDGLLVMSQELPDDKVLELRERELPFVLVNQHIPDKKLPCVFLDDVDGAYQATKYLIELGHRRIGFITGPRGNRGVKERIEGYKLALAEYDLNYSDKFIREGSYEREKTFQSVQNLLKLSQPPTAIFVADDAMALQAIEIIEHKGLKVPDDISVVGFNDMLELSTMEPALTTMKVPMVRMGEAAALLLLKLMREEEIEQSEIVLKAELVVGRTCKSIN